MLPSLFISHGSPMTILRDTPARRFMSELAATMPRPRAIVVASSHWETMQPAVNAVSINNTIHDFSGFPQALYDCQYSAPGDSELAEQIVAELEKARLPCGIDPQRGLDHGAWVPLSLIWPAANVPVVQLSIQPHLGPGHHMRMGRALAGLRAQDVLLIGAGGFTHNLRILNPADIDAPELPGVVAFSAWFHSALMASRVDDLLAYRTLAPAAVEQHPTDEHLLPLFFALGAGGDGAKAKLLHSSVEFGALRMDSYAFTS